MNEAMKCFNMHGHTYICYTEFEFNEMEDIGYAIDFKEIKRVGLQWIDDLLDHGMILNPKDTEVINAAKNTNSKMWLMSLNGEGNYCNPSVENIAKEIFLAMMVLFEPYKNIFIPVITNSIAKIGQASSIPHDSKLVTLELSSLIIRWANEEILEIENLLNYLMKMIVTSIDMPNRPSSTNQTLEVFQKLLEKWPGIPIKLNLVEKYVTGEGANQDISLNIINMLSMILKAKDTEWIINNSESLYKCIEPNARKDNPKFVKALEPVWKKFFEAINDPSIEMNDDMMSFNELAETLVDEGLHSLSNLSQVITLLECLYNQSPESLDGRLPYVIKLFQSIAKPNNASIFKLGYLDKETSQKLHESVFFDDLKPNHFGEVNGMILTSKEALEKVNGYDTFFHFYGAEDVDLCQRIENAGFTITLREELFFYHNWHVIYNSYNDQKMSLVPRLYNVKRINEQHYFTNKKEQLIQPHNQGVFGEVVSKENQDSLKNPDLTFTMNNIHSNVHHFFNEHGF
jgi:6-pyruvoyl-tetrahydropterin synthase